MEGDPKIDVDKMIENINKRNVGGILKNKKNDKTDELPFHKNESGINEEPKEATIIPIGKMSDDEIKRILSEANAPEEDIKNITDIANKSKEDLALNEVEVSILKFAQNKIDDTEIISKIEKIFDKYPQLKFATKRKLEQAIENIDQKIPSAKNPNELFDLSESLVKVWEHFFKKRSK